MYRSIVLATLLTLHASLPALGAAEPEYAESIERLDPMDTTGLDSGLATVLRNYYQRSFTGENNWAEIESLRFDGTLHLAQGVVRFTAFKKKPNYCKVVIYAARGGQVVMSYDGVDAWQFNAMTPGAQIKDMPPLEALNFIRDATTGGHLLYPLIAGKQIELLGIVDFDGRRHYELLTTLPDGQTIRSLLDVTTFAEVCQITFNNVSGDEEVTIHSDFREIDGLRVPFTSKLTVGGEPIHQTHLDRVQVNLGLTPWMFRRSSVADLTASAPGEALGAFLPDSQQQVSPAASEFSVGEGITDSWNADSAFNLAPNPFFEAGALPVLQEAEPKPSQP
ncbi:hypothetical protein ACWPKS_13860 [Coraliomargarita sp. W4R72]